MQKKAKIKDLIPALVADGNAINDVGNDKYDLIFFQKANEDEESIYFQTVAKIRVDKSDLNNIVKSINESLKEIDADKKKESVQKKK